MDKIQKTKAQKLVRQTNVLESLKDIGSATSKSLKKDLFEGTSEAIFDQILGGRQEKKYSGDIVAGESIEISDVFSGKAEENKKLKAQITLEKSLLEEERVQVEKKTNELKLQLHAISQEVVTLVQSTQNLSQEVQIAAMQAPIEPGVYHVIFFQKLLEFIKSFRKKIEDASIWLQSVNKRAMKKNYWSLYKQHGSKFLLSPDHYLQRSAG